jgi:hypothetical protein
MTTEPSKIVSYLNIDVYRIKNLPQKLGSTLVEQQMLRGVSQKKRVDEKMTHNETRNRQEPERCNKVIYFRYTATKYFSLQTRNTLRVPCDSAVRFTCQCTGPVSSVKSDRASGFMLSSKVERSISGS